MKAKGVYKCKAQNLNVEYGSEEITEVNGLHKAKKASEDVEILIIEKQICSYLPKNLYFHFPKIYHLDVHNSGLRSVTSENMKMFPKLKHLYIRNNPIEILPENLFQHNPLLEFINLNDNKILQVGANVFSGINNLISLSFERNPCFDGFAVQENAFKRLIVKIERNCTKINYHDTVDSNH